MLFVYLDHNIAVLILGEETCLKHFPRRHPGVGTAFLFSYEGTESEAPQVPWPKDSPKA